MQKKVRLFQGLFMFVLVVGLGSGCAPLQTERMNMGGNRPSGLSGGLNDFISKFIDKNPRGALAGDTSGTTLAYVVNGEMDMDDRRKMLIAIDVGSSDKAVAWFNSSTGNEYAVIPRKPYYPVREQPALLCRKTDLETSYDGRFERISLDACKDPQSQVWKLRNSSKS